jgi:hypothetical protein
MDQPLQLQIIKAWAAISIIVNATNIQTHIANHKCVTKQNMLGCPQYMKLQQRYKDDFNAYDKVVKELDTSFKLKEQFGP